MLHFVEQGRHFGDTGKAIGEALDPLLAAWIRGGRGEQR